MKKNGDANNNPIFMFIIAVVFIGGGLLAMIVKTEEAKPVWLTIVGVVLLVAGVAIFAWAIYRAIVISKYNKLLKDTTAYMTEATFAGSKFAGGSMTSVGAGGIAVPVKASVYKKVKYTYKDETGAMHTATSINSFTPNQVSFLEQKGTFKIKCKGSVSAIVEEVPNMNAMYNI